VSESGHPNEWGAHPRLGWLKWREFGRRGDTARDQVIQAQPLGTQTCAGCAAPSWNSEAGPSPPTPGAPLGGPPESWREASSRIRPLIRKDYPLSLSISLSGGEETNQDFPSNGERTGKSPA
jgi:hypothetical protein